MAVVGTQIVLLSTGINCAILTFVSGIFMAALLVLGFELLYTGATMSIKTLKGAWYPLLPYCYPSCRDKGVCYCNYSNCGFRIILIRK